MPNLPDKPIARKRGRLRKRYKRSRTEALLCGDDLYYPDAICSKCGVWAAYKVSDNACCGCSGSGPYAGKRIARNKGKQDRKIGRGPNPTRITAQGKVALTPAKHWHKAYK